MKSSLRWRVIATVGGPGTATPEHFTGPYAASKAALPSLMQTYALENAKTKLRVNCVDPGTVATRLRAEGFPGEDAAALATPELADRAVFVGSSSFPGRDRFCFLVFEHGYRHLLDFPNDTTNASGDLISQLAELVGKDNIQVENL